MPAIIQERSRDVSNGEDRRMRIPAALVSRKQSSTDRLTTEAETFSLATAMFCEVENLQGHVADTLCPWLRDSSAL